MYLASLSTLWTSSKEEEEGATGWADPTVVAEYAEDYEWSHHLPNADWNTLLDVFTVFALVLLVLGLIDLWSAHRVRNTRDMRVVRQLSF